MPQIRGEQYDEMMLSTIQAAILVYFVPSLAASSGQS